MSDVKLDETTAADTGPSKDDRVLAVLALMGGDRREVNERDLFLACWHTFPNQMRWVDTALPNPDTFTASLRRLDARGLIERIGKTERRKRKKAPRRQSALEIGRSGVVRARLREGALERARVSEGVLNDIGTRMPSSENDADPVDVLLACIQARLHAGMHVDEAVLVEMAFHRYPGVFAYRFRPELPDVGIVRDALEEARNSGLVSSKLELTDAGRARLGQDSTPLQLDTSAAFRAGVNKVADRIESSPAYVSWKENGTLALAKADELFRMLRIPPTTDPSPVVTTLRRRRAELLRVDRGSSAEYLLRLAELFHPDVYDSLEDGTDATHHAPEEGTA